MAAKRGKKLLSQDKEKTNLIWFILKIKLKRYEEILKASSPLVQFEKHFKIKISELVAFV